MNPIVESVLLHALGAVFALVGVAVAAWWFQPGAGSLVGETGLVMRVAIELVALVLYQHWAAPNGLGWALVLVWGMRWGLVWPRLPVRDAARDGGP